MANPRKWWHTTLRLLDRQSQEKTSITTVGSDPSMSAADFIFAYKLTCFATPIPPTAFSAIESPGYFIYRPSLDDIGGVSGNNYVAPQNFDDVVAINNRFIYEYQLRYSYDATDLDCTTTGPPDHHWPTPLDITTDSSHGAVFLFPTLPYFDQIGCCDIQLSHPGVPIEPGDINDCYRFWGIVSEGDSYHLYSWDFETSDMVDRGEIQSSGIGTLSFHDIAWDSDNNLWGLEVDGLRQLLPGSSSTAAVAMNYATVNDSFSGAATAILFPINATSDGYPGMSFNQHNDKLYISANDYFFELEKISDAVWNIVRYQSLGSGSELRDLAFDPYGNCFCVYNDNLCKINFETAFGTITPITSDSSFSTTTSLDFVLDFDHSQLVNLYSVDEDGVIFEVNYQNGSRSTIGGLANFGSLTVGGSSCQAGEDTTIPAFPFDPGNSPWIFMLDYSGSMLTPTPSGITRWQTLIDGMSAFLENNVQLNDEMVIITYAETLSVSPRYVFRTQTDIDDAVAYVQSLTMPVGGTNFCTDGPFNETFLQNYQSIRSIVVIGDGGFTNCPISLQPYLQGVYDFAVNNSNPELVMRGVGIYPDDLGRQHLTILGEVGGGGYTEWV
jgi:hypothetical protein